MLSTCSSVHLSRLTDLTREMCVPSLRWSPPQRMHKKTPRFQLAQRVPTSAAAVRTRPWRLRSAYPFVRSRHSACWRPASAAPSRLVHSCASLHPEPHHSSPRSAQQTEQQSVAGCHHPGTGQSTMARVPEALLAPRFRPASDPSWQLAGISRHQQWQLWNFPWDGLGAVPHGHHSRTFSDDSPMC